ESIGQAEVQPDGSFEFTPYGLPFVTGPSEEYDITAKVVTWNYVTGVATVSAPYDITIDEFLPDSSAFTSFAFDAIQDTPLLHPVLGGSIAVQTEETNGLTYNLVEPLYVEIFAAETINGSGAVFAGVVPVLL